MCSALVFHSYVMDMAIGFAGSILGTCSSVCMEFLETCAT